MKKILSVIICFCLIICSMITFSACKKEEKVDESKLQIVSTIFPGYDFAKQVGGENVQSWNLLSVGKESHSYEPTPKDIIKIQNSDLFIYVGGESDTWVDKVLNSLSKPVKTLKMMDYVTAIEEMEDDDTDHGDTDEIEYDEHVWTTPTNAKKIASAIRDALCEIDSENTTIYVNNCKTYEEKLTTLDNEIRTFANSLTNKVMVIADRHPLAYFALEYNFEVYAAFNGCSDETEPSTKKLKILIDKVKENNLSTIFYMEFSNHKTADSVADATGAKIATLHACHNVSQADKDAGTTYVDLMYRNLQTLKEAYK